MSTSSYKSKGLGQTISELADQLGKDVILEDVVLDQLASQSGHMCVSCPKKAAIKLCLDCAETYYIELDYTDTVSVCA
nr:hypothetical protein BaRGS_004693 [Batillaria attramentaria]